LASEASVVGGGIGGAAQAVKTASIIPTETWRATDECMVETSVFKILHAAGRCAGAS